jgi:L-histidine Nalpha-methyltransferase
VPYLEDALHRERIIHGMQAGTVPLKYAYAGSAAHMHDVLAHTSGYLSVVGAATHEVSALAMALPDKIPNQLAEIGPGNGTHTCAFLECLRQTDLSHLRYLGLDFSATLLAHACRRLGERNLVQDLATALWDIEEFHTKQILRWRYSSEPLLVCVLGHTLGNLEDPVHALRNIALSTQAGDFIVASLALMPPDLDETAVLSPYRGATFAAAVLEPLRAVGLDEGVLSLELRLAERAVVGEAVFNRATTFAGCYFSRRQRIHCFTSRRYLPQEAVQMFSAAGWDVFHTAMDEDATHLVVVARQ